MHFCKPALNVAIWAAGFTIVTSLHIPDFLERQRLVYPAKRRCGNLSPVYPKSHGWCLFMWSEDFTVGNQSTRDNVRIQDNHCGTT
jgi:hypothetical protein